MADTTFSRQDVDGFFLEYDTERAGGFEPLQGRKVVLGLVSSKFPALEEMDVLKRRTDQASRYIPLQNLCIRPQCGFSSTFHGNIMTIEQQAAKLRLCGETAMEVWGSL